jgi:hypothetical protein
LRSQDVTRVESQLNVGDANEGPREKSGPDQENQRKRDFGNDERVPQEVGSSAGS